MQDSVAVNHYERLKVTPDAPPEVIRAAYRALAAKLHPDRQTEVDARPPGQAHEQMVALNNSYLVLMDPAARQAYDATLGAFTETRVDDDRPPSFDSTQPETEPSTRVDVDWGAVMPEPRGPMDAARPWLAPVGMVVVGLAVGLGWWAAQKDKGLAYDPQLAARELPAPAALPATAGVAPAARAAVPGASAAGLTPEQMATMSNEELLAAVPQLLEQVSSAPAPTTPGTPAAEPTTDELIAAANALAGQTGPAAARAPAAPAATPARPAMPPEASRPVVTAPVSPLATNGRHPLDGAGPLSLKLGSLPAGRAQQLN